VSVEAISWALNLAPVPADRGGRPSSACKFVLVGLTNHAGPDGTGALPSVATLIRYTGLSERTVRTCLDRLESEGIISSCDPDIVAARIKRADRRPQGWDLDLSLTRGDLGEPGAAVPGSPSPAPGRDSPPPGGLIFKAVRMGCNPRTPPGPQITRCNGCTPQPGRGATTAPTGCNPRGHEVQRLHPNRSENPPRSRPPPLRPRVRARPPPAGGAAGRPTSSSPPSRTPGCSPASSEPGSPQPPRPRSAADGRPPRWPRSPAPTPRAYAIRSRCSPPGSHPPNCPRHPGGARPGRRGAASATRPPGCSASTPTRRARARAASPPPQPARPVPPRRWPAPVPVQLRHRCTAVTQCEGSPILRADRTHAERIFAAVRDPGSASRRAPISQFWRLTSHVARRSTARRARHQAQAAIR
jgi:hypothetical protein